MLGKILLTALVCGLVYLVWRHQKSQLLEQGKPASGTATQNPRISRSPRPPIKRLTMGVLLVMSLGSGVWMLLDWRERHTLLEVRVINPMTGSETAYQVLKKDLQENAFVTRDGQRIRIASSERLEVQRAPRN
ncbi:hypothetical protein [Marinospirillum alkaliphilum]|uniref:Uncharacterized protein n=1 Tax=Marinospirillum alkaliphilum DSM 21637 TaxID=1122209 RepID=A0A1K1XM92_9GAMM|nr:hypothetical protein [Marinospirillum alkaliphilum]SFX50712.1 hypothetical protein SAMN02745752_01918 [Marinospirillum alkaliphilum DSM 21637]